MILTFINELRISFLEQIFPEYILKSISKREGKCRQCGKCCKGCDHLEKNKCIIYNNRPIRCNKNFPIDKLDLWFYNIKECGYRWKEK